MRPANAALMSRRTRTLRDIPGYEGIALRGKEFGGAHGLQHKLAALGFGQT